MKMKAVMMAEKLVVLKVDYLVVCLAELLEQLAVEGMAQMMAVC